MISGDDPGDAEVKRCPHRPAHKNTHLQAAARSVAPLAKTRPAGRPLFFTGPPRGVAAEPPSRGFRDSDNFFNRSEPQTQDHFNFKNQERHVHRPMRRRGPDRDGPVTDPLWTMRRMQTANATRRDARRGARDKNKPRNKSYRVFLNTSLCENQYQFRVFQRVDFVC